MYRVREEIVEMTVEDPAPGFKFLRDKVDAIWFLQREDIRPQLKSCKHLLNNGSNSVEVHQNLIEIDSPLLDSIQHNYYVIERVLEDKSRLQSICRDLKLLLNQVKFVLRAWQFAIIHTSYSEGSDSAKRSRSAASLNCLDDDLFKSFRLSVKRELLKLNSLSRHPDVKEILDELYQEEEKRYLAVYNLLNE